MDIRLFLVNCSNKSNWLQSHSKTISDGDKDQHSLQSVNLYVDVC